MFTESHIVKPYRLTAKAFSMLTTALIYVYLFVHKIKTILVTQVLNFVLTDALYWKTQLKMLQQE